MVTVASIARIAMARQPIPNRKNLPLRCLLIKTNEQLHIDPANEIYSASDIKNFPNEMVYSRK